MTRIIKDRTFSFTPDMGDKKLANFFAQIATDDADFNGPASYAYNDNGESYLLNFTFAGGQLNSLRGEGNILKPAWVMTNYTVAPDHLKIVYAQAWAKGGQVLCLEEYEAQKCVARATWDPELRPYGFRRVRVEMMPAGRA